jgi:hypothetical protein
LWWFVVVCGEFPVFPGFTPVLRVVSSGNTVRKRAIPAAKTWSKRGQNVVDCVVKGFFRW